MIMENVNEKLSVKEEVANFNEKVTQWEFSPIGSNVVIEPYETSPYMQKYDENGLLLNTEGTEFNSKTGQEDERNMHIAVGRVIGVGQSCKYVKEGMDVFYFKFSTKVLPFGMCKLEVVNESNIVSVAMVGLSDLEEFKHIK